MRSIADEIDTNTLEGYEVKFEEEVCYECYVQDEDPGMVEYAILSKEGQLSSQRITASCLRLHKVGK